MANKLDKIEVSTKYNHLQIREIKDDGGFHRRALSCHQILAEDEHQEVKDKAEELWTDEVKKSWLAYQAEIKSKQENKEQT